MRQSSCPILCVSMFNAVCPIVFTQVFFTSEQGAHEKIINIITSVHYSNCDHSYSSAEY